MKVAIRSPREDKHGSHPIVEYNMPIIAPGEVLPPHKGFHMPKKVIDALNKPPEDLKPAVKKRMRPKPKKKPKKNAKRKVVGFHKICLKWVVGVIVNRHYKNKQAWKFKDAIFDEDGKYKYCQEWGKIPIYERGIKGSIDSKLRSDFLLKLSRDIELFCKNKLFVILNLNGRQKSFWADKIQKHCEMEKMKQMLKVDKNKKALKQFEELTASLEASATGKNEE